VTPCHIERPALSAVLIVSVIVCVCLSTSVARAEQGRPPDMAVRRVAGNVLISPAQPKIRLQVDKAFAGLPPLEFPIRNDTWVERYIFVDSAPDKWARRMVVVQFEHAQVGSSFRFVYPARPPMQWGSAVYRHGTFTADSAAEIAADPGLEVARTQEYLASKGYKFGNWWNVARLARAADPDGKTEIIVFYQEALRESVSHGNADDALPGSLAQELFARMHAAVTSD
jgi:hypothetical protein